ncbi:hypothetical protein CI109_105135 [Kwoniella shandongensis]|uniref:Uncharacterized protein n=1 Tax=Kwoniella shandongensis TaxID=1734106 RepID=A0A5M6C8M1_9TREE|nr:uncharacterized protein CI109_001974 [Kwoniella shandongensis]KAA5529549.1 hypothetical protein CI109_001974 [Kwoniella shandongensis]
MTSSETDQSRPGHPPLGLFIQPACLQHKYIRHANASHIFERPERLRAVLLGVAAAVARLEEAGSGKEDGAVKNEGGNTNITFSTSTSTTGDDLSGMLSSLSIGANGSGSSSFVLPTSHLTVIAPPPPPVQPGTILLHHPAVQIAHSPTPEAPFPYLGQGAASGSASFPTSPYLKDLFKWASEAVEKIRETGCEIPQGLGLNAGDLYLGPGTILAIEGAIQTVCQAVDRVTQLPPTPIKVETKPEPTTPPGQKSSSVYFDKAARLEGPDAANIRVNKAFCAIRPPGHHCGEDAPSGFCYVNNVVVGALHGYLQHDVDRAIIIDFDLHHGNGTQALVMPLNAAAYADDLQVKAGKPAMMFGKGGRRRRGWKGFYGSVHDIYSYPCEDGDIDLIKDASISLAAHGQYIENIHLQPYADEADFYARIYPLYLALLNKAKVFMEHTEADPSRTIVFISAGFDACEHEHQGMQRHDRRVPTSFYSRYTKDIVAFADKYTEGKVVSVLEGGYSDRALTSAAMGHIVGMTGSLPEKCDEWWTETELINIEKATKKKRTGKLQPFPSDLSSQPHLLRTHALLGHFEGAGAPESTAPSVASTPIAGMGRMTLRDRSRKVDDSAPTSTESTPTVRRPARGRGGGGTGVTTPSSRSKIVEPTTITTPTAGSRATKAPPPAAKNTLKAEEIRLPQSELEGSLSKMAEDSEKQDPVEQALQGLAGVSLNGASIEGVAESSGSRGIPRIAPVQSALASSSTSIPKIILRIPRPNPTSGEQPTTRLPLSSFPSTAQNSVYPSLPPPPSSSADPVPLSAQEKMAYRDDTSSATDEDAEGETDTEYVSAQSGIDDRDLREGSTVSGTSLSSGGGGGGPDMPGGFGK